MGADEPSTEAGARTWYLFRVPAPGKGPGSTVGRRQGVGVRPGAGIEVATRHAFWLAQCCPFGWGGRLVRNPGGGGQKDKLTSSALVGGREEDVVGRHRRSDRSGGFSLLEALFVVAILGILLALAFPSYQRVVMERRVQNTTREIAGLLRVAQQAAVAKSAEAKCVSVAFEERGVLVYVVPQEASFDCTSPSGSGLRAYGVLLRSQEYSAGVSVEHRPSDALAFQPSGVVYPTCAGDNCTAFQVTVRGGGQVRHACVNAAGLVSVPPPGEDCPQ